MKKILSLILSFVLISSVNAFAVSIDDINSAISDTENIYMIIRKLLPYHR